MEKYINSTGNGFLGKHYYGTNYECRRRKIELSNKELDEVLSRIDEGYTVRFDNQLSLQQLHKHYQLVLHNILTSALNIRICPYIHYQYNFCDPDIYLFQ